MFMSGRMKDHVRPPLGKDIGQPFGVPDRSDQDLEVESLTEAGQEFLLEFIDRVFTDIKEDQERRAKRGNLLGQLRPDGSPSPRHQHHLVLDEAADPVHVIDNRIAPQQILDPDIPHIGQMDPLAAEF